MVRTISLIVEAAFGLIAILILCLWHISYRQRSNLKCDPASIANIMALAHSKDETRISINDDGTLTSEELEDELSLKRFRLQASSDDCHLLAVLEPTEKSMRIESRGYSASVKRRFSPVQPMELGIWFGTSFAAILVVSLGILVFLETWSSKHQGKMMYLDTTGRCRRC